MGVQWNIVVVEESRIHDSDACDSNDMFPWTIALQTKTQQVQDLDSCSSYFMNFWQAAQRTWYLIIDTTIATEPSKWPDQFVCGAIQWPALVD